MPPLPSAFQIVATCQPLEMFMHLHRPILIAAVVLVLRAIRLVQGGICWSNMNEHGRCMEMLSEQTSREDCCGQYPGVSTAWSAEDLESGSLFFYRALGGGVRCFACKDTCDAVECGSGKKCMVRGGRPKCVCAPNCKESRKAKGPVCGTDGRSYLNVCRLRKRACRKRNTALSVAYQGFCQSNCDQIICPAGKFCVLDQNLSPHCVRCMRCSPTKKSSSAHRPICGSDGITYPNTCVLREAACRKGKAIPVAYKGRCKESASCGSVRCRDRQSCLIDRRSGRPRCVTCVSHCSKPAIKDLGGPICGNNNRTYPSWCHMMRDSCATGFVIETHFAGQCSRSAGAVSLTSNMVVDEEPSR